MNSISLNEKCKNEINNLKTGDIIQFKFLIDNDLHNKHPGRRSISTYGFEEIEPEENTDYVVTNIEKYGIIPNHKCETNFNKSMNNVDTFIYVFPKQEYDKMNGLFQHTKEIFWFINLSKMTICQFEDAYPINSIDTIWITGYYK